MDIELYLKERRSHVEQQSQRVKDFSVFDFNYVPERPLMREECKDLVDAMLRFEATGIPTNMAIVGSRGSGKTLTLRYLQRLIPGQTALEVLYANCRHHNTSYKILTHLLSAPTAGSSLSQLFDRFVEDREAKAVMVLDEVDLMSPKDKRREILYLLSRSEKPFMVIMLSNSPHVLKQLDAATRSSLQPVPLHFRDYNAEEVRTILRDRAALGLHDFDAAHLAEISAMTTRLTNSDARVAIKTLFYQVTTPEESVTDAFERARRDIVVDMIGNLSDGNLMILWAAATEKSGLAKDVYARYCRYSQDHGEKPFSYVYFYSNLSYLQSMGLIGLASAKVGRTYTYRLQLAFDATVVTSLCRLRFA